MLLRWFLNALALVLECSCVGSWMLRFVRYGWLHQLCSELLFS